MSSPLRSRIPPSEVIATQSTARIQPYICFSSDKADFEIGTLQNNVRKILTM